MAKWANQQNCAHCRATEGQEHSFWCEARRPPFGAEGKPVNTGYEPLRRVLDLALKQASDGKGNERHANGKPFDKQPMLEIGRMVGAGFCLGQAMKKAQEASRMDREAAKRELLGAINYLAGAYLLLEEDNSPV